MGYIKSDSLNCIPQKSFAVVSQLDLIRGYGLNDMVDAIVPISGPGKYLNNSV